ncbi:sex-determining region Y protein-like [Portunus trituberculatus]|uniref:sex-determining region Y protein-like n=1 Tax=Portunus trituberculatus TaxID=210409 RepID=UPI001E1CECB1|nr:sex-determining region Y protein-like [Portunus trituberculatus]
MNTSEAHVKRPLNAFMVWSCVRRRQISVQRPELPSSEVSKLLGAEWANMTDAEKSPFFTESKRLRLLHLRKYPNYKYRPRRKTRKPADHPSRPSAQFPVLQSFKEGFLPFLPTTQHPLRPVPDSAACPTMYPLRWPQLDELSGYPAAFLESFPTQQWSASLHLPAPQLIPTSSSSSSSSHNLPSDLNPRDTPGIFRPWESEKKEVSENHHAAAGQ